MATGVVTARGLVSELVDCHAHDTVSAMSYRDRSEGHAFAIPFPEALEIIHNLKEPVIAGRLALLVIGTLVIYDLLMSIDAGAVITCIVNIHVEDGFPAYFISVIDPTLVHLRTNVDGKSIRGGGKEGKC